MSGALFWALATYAMAGLVSGVALGPEWLRAANSAGVRHVTMLLPGVCFLGAALIFRVALLRRGKADAVCWFFSLLAWAAVCGAAAQSGAGWIGRWPGSDNLRLIHMLVVVFALSLTALAAIATLRMALASTVMIFRVPAALLTLGAAATVAHSVAEFALGVVVSELWVVTAVALSAAALRVATLTPHKRKEPEWQRKETTKPVS